MPLPRNIGTGRALLGGGLSAPVNVDFTALADGALPAPFSGSTWAISGSKAVNTPGTGAELCTDGDMEAGNVTNWTAIGTPVTREKSTTQAHAGTQSLRIVADADAEGATSNNIAVVNGGWYQATEWVYFVGGNRAFAHHDMVGSLPGITVTTLNTWTRGRQTRWITANANAHVIGRTYPQSPANGEAYFDDFSMKKLNTNDLGAFVAYGQKDVIARITFLSEITLQVGLFLNVDSASNPQNYVALVSDRNPSGGNTTLYLLKCVAGSLSQVGTTETVSYLSGGKLLELRKSGTTYKIYYDNAQVGLDRTISDAGIINNTTHGILSTDGGCSVQSFFLGAN